MGRAISAVIVLLGVPQARECTRLDRERWTTPRNQAVLRQAVLRQAGLRQAGLRQAVLRQAGLAQAGLAQAGLARRPPLTSTACAFL